MGTSQETGFNWIIDVPYLMIHGLILFTISYMLFTMQHSPYFGYYSSILAFSALIVVMIIMMLGLVNVIISESLWSMNIRSNGENWLFQGFLILVPTQFLMIPFSGFLYAISQLDNYYNFASAIILFLAYLLIFGVIGKIVAGHFPVVDIEKSQLRKKSEPLDKEGTRYLCIHCGASHKYPDRVITDRRTVRCFTCGKESHILPKSELMKQLEEHSDSAFQQ